MPVHRATNAATIKTDLFRFLEDAPDWEGRYFGSSSYHPFKRATAQFYLSLGALKPRAQTCSNPASDGSTPTKLREVLASIASAVVTPMVRISAWLTEIDYCHYCSPSPVHESEQ